MSWFLYLRKISFIICWWKALLYKHILDKCCYKRNTLALNNLGGGGVGWMFGHVCLGSFPCEQNLTRKWMDVFPVCFKCFCDHVTVKTFKHTHVMWPISLFYCKHINVQYWCCLVTPHHLSTNFLLHFAFNWESSVLIRNH